ncbi:MAG: GspMb/PilO family protein [Patescibacteria group bacterium]
MTTYTAHLRQSANIRFALIAAILVITGVFLFWPDYKQLQSSLAEIAKLDDQIKSVSLELEGHRDQYRILKNDYALAAVRDESTITTILPLTANETDIVRALEQQARDISGDNSSLVLNSINIGSANNQDKSDYLALPIKISLTGTKEKLMSFLHTLEKTGGAAENSEASTRLISVQDINLQAKDRGAQTEASNEEISMEISVNAYFLPTLQEQAASAK